MLLPKINMNNINQFFKENLTQLNLSIYSLSTSSSKGTEVKRSERSTLTLFYLPSFCTFWTGNQPLRQSPYQRRLTQWPGWLHSPCWGWLSQPAPLWPSLPTGMIAVKEQTLWTPEKKWREREHFPFSTFILL